MKNTMKKMTAFMLTALMCATLLAGFASCSSTDNSDLKTIRDKGKLVVGITDFAPMDYQEDGKWVGFDAELAQAFAESLGVEAEFVIIDWKKKVMELDSGAIDCVWNGMTLTDDVKEAMSVSDPYCNNAQVVIVKKDVAENYKTAEDCKTLKFAVETGSAGKEMAEANGYSFTEVKDQASALMEVQSGASDAAIIDSLMAGAMVGEGTGYEELSTTVKLNSELYGVGFRKGSDLTEKLNEFFKTAWTDGTITRIATKYGTQESVIEQK